MHQVRRVGRFTPTCRHAEFPQTVRFRCGAQAAVPVQEPVLVVWGREGGAGLPARAQDDGRGGLVIRQVQQGDSGIYICTASSGQAPN